jgi:hypothetical protein
MCDCVLYVALFAFGMYALIAGKLQVAPGRVCTGMSARLVGVLLILSPVLAFGSAMIYGLIKGLQIGASGQTSLTPEQMKEVQTTANIISLSLGIGCAIVAGVVAFLLGKPPQPKRSMEDEERAYRRAVETDDLDERNGDRDLPPSGPADEHFRPRPE